MVPVIRLHLYNNTLWMFYNEKIFFLFHIKSKDACIVVGKEDELMPFVKVDVKKEIAERRERDPEFRKAWDRRKRQKADEVINTINKAVPGSVNYSV